MGSATRTWCTPSAGLLLSVCKWHAPRRLPLYLLTYPARLLHVGRAPPGGGPGRWLLMLTAGDTWLLADWLHRHERLFEALAVLDGSAAVGFAQKAVLTRRLCRPSPQRSQARMKAELHRSTHPCQPKPHGSARAAIRVQADRRAVGAVGRCLHCAAVRRARAWAHVVCAQGRRQRTEASGVDWDCAHVQLRRARAAVRARRVRLAPRVSPLGHRPALLAILAHRLRARGPRELSRPCCNPPSDAVAGVCGGGGGHQARRSSREVCDGPPAAYFGRRGGAVPHLLRGPHARGRGSGAARLVQPRVRQEPASPLLRDVGGAPVLHREGVELPLLPWPMGLGPNRTATASAPAHTWRLQQFPSRGPPPRQVPQLPGRPDHWDPLPLPHVPGGAGALLRLLRFQHACAPPVCCAGAARRSLDAG